MRLMSPLFRAAQTGFTQNYALVMVLGLMVAVARVLCASDIVCGVIEAQIIAEILRDFK